MNQQPIYTIPMDTTTTIMPSCSTASTTPIVTTTPSYEGFQPPLDHSQQQECYSPTSSNSIFSKYEDQQQQKTMVMMGKPTIATTLSRSSSLSSSTNHQQAKAAPCSTTTATTEFKATFYNPFETKHRRRTSKQQFKILEAAFEENPKPSAPKRQALANDLGMTPRGVQIWFQNRRAKAKQRTTAVDHKRSFEESHSTSAFEEEDEEENQDSTHRRHRRRRTSNYYNNNNKPFYTEWDSQEPIVTNDGASNGTIHTSSHSSASNSASTPMTPTITSTTNTTPHVTTTSAPASPSCITTTTVVSAAAAAAAAAAGINPVQAPSLYYCYSDASSSPVTPSVPSPTLQQQQEQHVHSVQQVQEQPFHQSQPPLEQPEFLMDYNSKSMWSPMNDAPFVNMDNSYCYITDWIQTVPHVRPPLRQDLSVTSIATSGFGPEEDEILSQWPKEPHPHHQQVTSFPNSPQELHQQPIYHTTTHSTTTSPTTPTTTADNKDNSIALARVFDTTSMVNSATTTTTACNFVPAPIDVHWIPDQPHTDFISTW